MAAIAFLASCLLGLLLGPLSVVLLIVAETWTGRGFALLGLLSCAACLCGSIGWLRRREQLLRLAKILLPLDGVLALALILQAPEGAHAGYLRNVYATGHPACFHRYALGNLVPEVDQVMLGFTLAPILDPLLTLNQAARLKEETRHLYREMNTERNFDAVGSVLPDVYAELWNGKPITGHSYVYVPKSVSPGTKTPVILYFHGTGGNLKAFIWILSRLAIHQKAILIAPSFGMGFWNEADAARMANEALSELGKSQSYDQNRIHVIGLSNGGLAVSQLLQNQTFEAHSYCFLSPVFADRLVDHAQSLPDLKQHQVFILTGAVDDRVPLSYVRIAGDRISHAGATVQMTSFDDADHFLFFSHRERMLEELKNWMRKD